VKSVVKVDEDAVTLGAEIGTCAAPVIVEGPPRINAARLTVLPDYAKQFSGDWRLLLPGALALRDDKALVELVKTRIMDELILDALCLENQARQALARDQAAEYQAAEMKRMQFELLRQSWRDERAERWSWMDALEFWGALGARFVGVQLHREGSSERYVGRGTGVHGSSSMMLATYSDVTKNDSESVLSWLGDSGHDGRKLAIGLRASKKTAFFVESGAEASWEKFAARFKLRSTLSWHINCPNNGVEGVYHLYAGATVDYSGDTVPGVEIVDSTEAILIPPDASCIWTESPAAVAEGWTLEANGLPSVPGELVTLLRDLKNTPNAIRLRAWKMLIEEK